jgi:hypothetical protein
LKDFLARQSEEPLVSLARLAIAFQNDIDQGQGRVRVSDLR